MKFMSYLLFPAKAVLSEGHGHSHGINPNPTSSTSIRDFLAVLALSLHAVFEVRVEVELSSQKFKALALTFGN